MFLFLKSCLFLSLPIFGFSLVASRGGPTLWLRHAVVSLGWLLLLRSVDSMACGLLMVLAFLLQSTDSRACGLQRLWCTGSLAPGIFPDQGWDLRLLHWQVDFLPLSHQGSPHISIESFLLFLLTSRCFKICFR